MKDTTRTLIIAEAGVNHNGEIELAKKLIDAAVEAGADVVKFQTFTAKSLVTSDARKANYQINDIQNETQYEMLSRLELSLNAHKELFEYCANSGIEFFSTAFDIESLMFLEELGTKRIKIPSGEITNYPYLIKAASFNKPIILSTGMSSMSEIEAALGTLEKGGSKRDQITVLHCTSSYPAPMRDINLSAMLTIKNHLNVNVGYSDHSAGIEIPIAAVVMGARIIEKHFTLDRKLPGPDHKASLEPNELREMIKSIRNIEIAIGSGEKKITESERDNILVVRKSIVATTRILQGEVFSELNITTKRPGTGINPMNWLDVIGKEAKRDFDPEEFIEL